MQDAKAKEEAIPQAWEWSEVQSEEIWVGCRGNAPMGSLRGNAPQKLKDFCNENTKKSHFLHYFFPIKGLPTNVYKGLQNGIR